MANKEHVTILKQAVLKQGVDAWNKWREEHPNIQPDLSWINLREAFLHEINVPGDVIVQFDLSRANLSKTNLRGVYLDGSILRDVNLSGAILSSANLSRNILAGADLSGVDLYEANLHDCILQGANLSEADLNSTNLSRTILDDANFNQAKVGWTILTGVNLQRVKGLDTVIHRGPSSIGIDTIYRSQGLISETFLRKAGVLEDFITYMRSLVGKPIEYYSCFISYSSKDDDFAKRLYADLQNNNVRCWFAPEDLKWGEHIRSGIDEAIHMHDKLLLILSKHSVASGWVEREVKTALAREKKEKRTVLFPVRVDNAVFDCPYDWATEIRHERNIGDFTRWKSHDEYQKAFNRLLRDLKSETTSNNE